MALRYLGPGFEIHTGGIDNVFPHHEDEIAQSTPVAGGPPVRHWVHGEHLLASGRKMAKSTGNFERVTELRDRGIDPLAFRYLTLTVRYGRKLNYSPPSIEAAAAALGSLRAHLAALGPPPADGPFAAPPALRAGSAGPRPTGIADGCRRAPGRRVAAASPDIPLTDRAHEVAAPLSPAARALHDRFVAAIDDDLDLPTALAVVREALRTPDIAADERRWLVLDADLVLGLDLDRVWAAGAGVPGSPAGADEALPAGAAALLEARSAARSGTGLEPRRRAARRPRGAGDRGRRRRRRAPRGAAARRDLGRVEQQVATRRVSLEHAVEVPLRQPLAVRLGHRRPAAVVVAGDVEAGHAHGPSRHGHHEGSVAQPDGVVVGLAVLVVVVRRERIAEHEAPPDVEVPVEGEVLVQRPARHVVLAPERLRVALDRDDVHGAGRGLLEPCAGRR